MESFPIPLGKRRRGGFILIVLLVDGSRAHINRSLPRLRSPSVRKFGRRWQPNQRLQKQDAPPDRPTDRPTDRPSVAERSRPTSLRLHREVPSRRVASRGGEARPTDSRIRLPRNTAHTTAPLSPSQRGDSPVRRQQYAARNTPPSIAIRAIYAR